MNKQIILHSYNGMQLSYKKALTKNRTKRKKTTDTSNIMEKSQLH